MPTTNQSSHSESSGASLSEDEPPELTQPLYDLAQWAFGPKGLLFLQVIAFGDFSYEGRYAQSNVFLCRNIGPHQVHGQDMAGQTFRHLSDDDQSLRDLLDKYSEILEACPADPLLED
jgi:hypothetical protein